MSAPLVTVCLLALMSAPLAGADGFGPWSVDSRHPAIESWSARGQQATGIRTHPGQTAPAPFTLAYQVWAHLLTRIDGPRCAHTPTCSAFTAKAIARFRLPLGIWMAFDRLTRGADSSSLRPLPLRATGAGIYLVDDLADHAFWRSDYSPWSGRKK